LLDLYRPVSADPVPVAVYLHGGGFAVGSRADDADTRLAALAAYGVAVASADYRLAPGARFPDPVEDVRQAVRWLVEHGGELGLSVGKVGLWGASAGAVLAALAALAGPALTSSAESAAPELDDAGSIGCVVFWFGMSDLRVSGYRSGLETMISPPPAPERNLLGVEDIEHSPALAIRASPLTHVSAAAPPFLISHGDRDRVVAIQESIALHEGLTRAGASSTFVTVGGAGHEDARFDTPAHLSMTAAFLRAHLRVEPSAS
jgi:acetyl esterase/lipase